MASRQNNKAAVLQLARQYKALEENAPEGIDVWLDDDDEEDFFNWKCAIQGPPGTL